MSEDKTQADVIEELRWKEFKVLDKGYVTLVDVMGSDQDIVDAARVSYGAGTQKVSDNRQLLRYLMRSGHSSPFEQAEVKLMIKLPFDAHRQQIRHRTACLSGDTEIVFEAKGGYRRPKQVSEVYRLFQPTENARPDRGGSLYNRDRVRRRKLRCVNEATGEVGFTHIADIWESGVKKLFKVSAGVSAASADVRCVRASANHLFFTPEGWKKLKQLRVGDEVFTVTKRQGIPKPVPNTIDAATELWRPIVDWEEYYEVSSQGRVRRIASWAGAAELKPCKQLCVKQGGRPGTSLFRPGAPSRNILVHHELLLAFVGEPEEGQVACHRNGNSMDNRLGNLYWGTRKENQQDMVKHGHSGVLALQPNYITAIEADGEEMTYDIEVAGPHHNFSANDFVVHNSVNEYSTRYSVAIDDRQQTAPHQWRTQSTDNKQGSAGFLTEWPEDFEGLSFMNGTPVPDHVHVGTYLSTREQELHKLADEVYKERLALGVAREQARKDLPLSTYTKYYWKMDLHNLFHYLNLRMDSHAQKEIRELATTIGNKIVKPLFPLSYEAFLDYKLNSLVFTGPELQVLQNVVGRYSIPLYDMSMAMIIKGGYTNSLSNREVTEFEEKLRKTGLLKC